jgi:ubiquinone/menaquinone biosynthesis C-methylase UbiE
MLYSSAKNFVKKIIIRYRSYFQANKNLSLLDYWEERVKKYGKMSVLNLGHSPDEFEQVGQKQKQEIFPHFLASLKGDEKVVLDFGCGCGRFTIDLASLVGGKAIGVDPIKSLIEIAPKNNDVEYKVMEAGKIPLPDCSVDVVWICLVIGGIAGDDLDQTVQEINRVLKNNGLLFIIENTSHKTNVEHWHFYTIDDLKKIFNFASLIHLHDYFDMNEKISIMAGRKNV